MHDSTSDQPHMNDAGVAQTASRRLRTEDLLLRRSTLLRLACGLATVATAGPVAAQEAATSERNKGGPLPALGSTLALPEMPYLDGSPFKPESTDGRLFVLYWWASWCPFCAVQSPWMEALWKKHGARGLNLLGLSIDKKPEDAIAYRTKRGFTFPSTWVTPTAARALPKPKGLPVTLVRGRDGRVLMAEGGQLFPEDVEQIARFI